MTELNKLYPIEIVQARYSGVYEGGGWLAFPAGTYDRNLDAFADDVSCADWWQSNPLAARVGRGNSPDAALADLVHRDLPAAIEILVDE